jgi:hypothetical protein
MRHAPTLVCLLLLAACGEPATPVTPPPPSGSAPSPAAGSASSSAAPVAASPPAPAAPTFADDVAFLRAHGEIEILEAPGGGRIAVSPKYQGRVMTSAVAADGRSIGFLHRAFIEAGKTGTAFDNYGGEDRFWLGPEGGQFALYFPPGAPFSFDRWQTPAAFQEGAWPVVERSPQSLTMKRSMHVVNYAGTAFDLEVTRTVRLLSEADAKARLGMGPGEGVKLVAFETENRVTNTGKSAWTKDKGLLSMWILAMYNPSPDTNVVIPFAPGSGPIVNDRYFGKVPAERLVVREGAAGAEGHLFFRCDGHYRSKIGVGPARATPSLGSYSESAGLLTVVQFDKPKDATDYVNSMWEKQKEPFGGDVVNSYNDGPTEPGKASLGGFYEIETSSPALALAPGASATHTHRTFHFVGGRAGLDPIAEKALGVKAGAVAEGIR